MNEQRVIIYPPLDKTFARWSVVSEGKDTEWFYCKEDAKACAIGRLKGVAWQLEEQDGKTIVTAAWGSPGGQRIERALLKAGVKL